MASALNVYADEPWTLSLNARETEGTPAVSTRAEANCFAILRPSKLDATEVDIPSILLPISLATHLLWAFKTTIKSVSSDFLFPEAVGVSLELLSRVGWRV